MEEYFEMLHSALDEYLMSLTVRVQKEDEGYRAILEQMEALQQAHPWLEELYDTALAREVPREEYPALQELLQIQIDDRPDALDRFQAELATRDRRAAYCRGLYAALGFLRRAGVL